MIACRSVFLKFTNTYVAAAATATASHRIFQGKCSYHSLRCNYMMRGRNRKKRICIDDKNSNNKPKTMLWRPVSTTATSSSLESLAMKDLTVESEDGGQVRATISTDHTINEAVVVTDETTESATFFSNDEQRVIEGESSSSIEKHSVSVEVGTSLFRFIKGKGGSTQQKIEEELGVKIIIPTSKEDDFVTIEGISVDSVNSAAEKIQAIIDESVNSRNLDYSHFISLPLAIHPELVDKLINFQNSILGNEDASTNEDEDTTENTEVDQLSKENVDVAVELKVEDGSAAVKVNLTNIPLVSYAPKASKSSKSSTSSDLGIDKSIFIKPKTFHLTVLMLKLWNKDRVKRATEVLQSISSKIMDALDNRPLSIRLKGLDCMKGSLAKARVLYAPVEEIGSEGRLLRACQVIIDAYTEAGLVLENDAKQSLKLHATVMNARHRKRKTWTRKADSFDARGIFKRYGSEEWGEYLIREAHLSQRFSFDETGYYHCCTSITFPEEMQVE
ncbi:uncharacterized protein LOC130941271 [Arachis stenosperma]|uniref:uncharacterized protein LOC130941271 n=1 Tax=Arachis stenosperma TaxID=217475 RepID=UPI0025ABF24C|nr:uncharacterized protein LOC130941271 [Arachis stenosperma]